jgi:hypothetical protein
LLEESCFLLACELYVHEFACVVLLKEEKYKAEMDYVLAYFNGQLLMIIIFQSPEYLLSSNGEWNGSK